MGRSNSRRDLRLNHTAKKKNKEEEEEETRREEDNKL
jgi:hypothetical protein